MRDAMPSAVACRHHRILDQPWGGKVLGICIKCGDEKWYSAYLEIDMPLRERVPNVGAGDPAQHKAMNAVLRQDRVQRRPWARKEEL